MAAGGAQGVVGNLGGPLVGSQLLGTALQCGDVPLLKHHQSREQEIERQVVHIVKLDRILAQIDGAEFEGKSSRAGGQLLLVLDDAGQRRGGLLVAFARPRLGVA